ncbi:MAG: glycogen/starch synthase, partial [Candidatus Rokuibacteriota bacterium]
MANLVTARGGEPVSIVHITAEYFPYARTGGLAEAVAGLANFQHAAGLDVTAILPLYRSVRDEDPDLEPVGQPFVVTIGTRNEA